MEQYFIQIKQDAGIDMTENIRKALEKAGFEVEEVTFALPDCDCCPGNQFIGITPEGKQYIENQVKK
mgnify:CR=1 FL=1|jgi:hypothetical protein